MKFSLALLMGVAAAAYACCAPLAVAQAPSEADPAASGYVPSSLSSVESLIKRAVTALHEQNYKGRFTYEFGSVLETLEVVHVVEDGVAHERILHLSGKKREFLRSRKECLTAGGMLLTGERLITESQTHQLSENYYFHIGIDERVAGRQATLVQIIPKDEYRYSLTVGFDKQSGLPLLSLLGSAQNTIERFQFIELIVGDEVSAMDIAPRQGPYQTLDHLPSRCLAKSTVGTTSIAEQHPAWQVGWLPPGFVLSQAETAGDFETVLTYTDGLAAFTVFVGAANGEQAPELTNGAARRGATLVLVSAAQVEGQNKTLALVGEVPLVTARQVLASVRPAR